MQLLSFDESINFCSTVYTGINHASNKIRSLRIEMLDYLAFGEQFDQINVIEKINPALAKLKKASLINHMKTVTEDEKWQLGLNLLLEKLDFIKIIAMRILYSASWFKSLDACINNTDPEANDKNIVKDFVEKVSKYNLWVGDLLDIYSKDHQQLNGLIIYGNETKDRDLPVFVMAAPRHVSYAYYLNTAQALAKLHHINVLLYDPRGIGLSLGSIRTTENVIEDCKAVIQYALKNFCNNDPARLGVFGYSWGGGITAESLKQLRVEGHSPIGLYINYRSFSSMAKFIGCPPINEAALAVLGLNPLDAGKAISEHMLADKVVVVKADGDRLMSGQFDLTNYLQSIHYTDIPEFFEEKATSRIDGRILEGHLDHGGKWDMTFLIEKIATWSCFQFQKTT